MQSRIPKLRFVQCSMSALKISPAQIYHKLPQKILQARHCLSAVHQGGYAKAVWGVCGVLVQCKSLPRILFFHFNHCGYCKSSFAGKACHLVCTARIARFFISCHFCLSTRSPNTSTVGNHCTRSSLLFFLNLKQGFVVRYKMQSKYEVVWYCTFSWIIPRFPVTAWGCLPLHAAVVG